MAGDRELRWLLAALWFFAGAAKLITPDAAALVALASRLRVEERLVERGYTLVAILEVALSVAILVRRRPSGALWVSFTAAFLGLAAWLIFRAMGIGCGCFGAFAAGLWVRLGIICALLSLSFATIWRSVPAEASI